MNIAEKLTKLCEQKGWRQADVIRQMERKTGEKVSRSTISAWLSEQGEPATYSILLLARTFEVPMEFLADEAMEEIPEVNPAITKILEMVKDIGPQEAIRRLYQRDPVSAVAPTNAPFKAREGFELGRNRDEKTG